MNAIINGKIILPNEILEDHIIVYEDKIIDIIHKDNFDSENINIIDAKNNYVSPGFIDIHIHGSMGYDTMDGELESIENISKSILQNGVTSFLPTTMTMDMKSIYRSLDTVRNAMNIKIKGARVLGAHLEGPFISPKYKGAQNSNFIEKPNYELIKNYIDVIKIITYAPEEDKDFDFLKSILQNKDITLSMGHTNASYEEALEAIKKGVTHSTHMFNAMTPLHHRNPGVVGAIMSSDITSEIIADNIHLHRGIYEIVNRVKGSENIVLITDAMRAQCLKEGKYDLGGQEVIVKNNSARLLDKTLAGSVLKLNEGVKNLYKNTTLKLYECVKLASANPAKVINIDDIGSIEKGKYADIILFDDDIKIKKVIIEGVVKHENN
ncbi:N-acetylglucosamine-6-phosphate deacetylase [Clostridium sp. D2Q-14]|uniref:N-acetylglucosamine-6-phosphate deacetylase n=1 Tax=Anaeromonas gelatinilytica TaxID=2683194 RepID=UPI00193B41B4|nr:N-acetylglucosamine-6-phosphate deacetylase [Anaeromonas gelatinilytica]MBS4535267.1 N-acetylglucosamine-6-phosphate deacetylase [Anaeromonas gelatinilytica]